MSSQCRCRCSSSCALNVAAVIERRARFTCWKDSSVTALTREEASSANCSTEPDLCFRVAGGEGESSGRMSMPTKRQKGPSFGS